MKTLRILLSCILVAAPGAAGQSVTILHGHADAQTCSMDARLAASSPVMGQTRSDSACTRALAQKELYTVRDLAALYMNRGIIRMGLEEYQTAFADYRKAYELKPDLPEVHINLGNLYFLAGNIDEAIEFYDSSLEMGLRKSHIAYLNRGMAHAHAGRLERAEQDYRQALTLVPEWQMAMEKLATLEARIDAQHEGRSSSRPGTANPPQNSDARQ